MTPVWSSLISDVGTVVGILTAVAAFLLVVSKGVLRVFGHGVRTHVTPLVAQLSNSLDNVASTVQDVQREQAATAERFAADMHVKSSALDAHRVTLDDHSDRLAEHHTRIAIVEVQLRP